MSRVCGSCGESGHNKRTCTKRGPDQSGPRSVASYASSRPAHTFALDEETLEAIDWYLESRQPGYLANREKRANTRARGVVTDIEEDD